MSHIDFLLNYVVHLPVTEKELEDYLSEDENISIPTGDVLMAIAETALRNQLTDFSDSIEIDADHAVGEVVKDE